MGSAVGVLKQAAARIGVSPEEYERRGAAGEKWCGGHRCWHSVADFAADRSRASGLTASCSAYRNDRARADYEPRPRPDTGRRFVEPRDGDKLQARRRINYLVEASLIPNPNAVRCTDCQHLGADKRHEYDHYLGYDATHHEDVEAVCTKCHGARERVRRG